MWAKAERLTSGARDANLPAVDCAIGAGCIMTWQEDPEGLRTWYGSWTWRRLVRCGSQWQDRHLVLLHQLR